MNEIDSQIIELDEEPSPPKDTHFFQIDFLKAAMIFLVIFDHMVSWNIKNDIGVALWERISIPVFLVIMGFNMGYSFRRHGASTLKQLYSWRYFKSKILRYILPFAILYAASTFIGLFMYGFDFELMYNLQYVNHNHGFINLFYLYMPFWGPGNWFIMVIMQSILIVPFLYWLFTRSRFLAPILTLILTFVVEIIMQLIVFFAQIGYPYSSWEEVYLYTMFASSLPYYLSAVGLGLWLSLGHKLTKKRNIRIWVVLLALLPISLWYIIAYQFFDYRIIIGGERFLRGDYTLLVFPYSAFLVLLALNLLPKTSKSWISRKISLISNSTYHILLTQILGYGMVTAWWGTHYLMDAPFNPNDLIDLVAVWIVFVWFGIGWYKIDNQKDIFRKILYYLNFFILFACTLLFIFWLQGFWIPISLIVIICYAIAAFIVHLTLKRPLPRLIVLVWTAFLVCSFIVVILQV
ncbi:MAG: acyltransferase family protein, partial [Candidatus Hermodarchaeota archaeon]